MKILKTPLCLFLLGFLISCSHQRNDSNDLREGEHIQRLSDFLGNELYSINIDELEQIYIDINPDVELTALFDSTLIADLSDVEVDGNDIYLVDRQKHQIVKYDGKNQSIAVFGRQGRGPADFNQPSEIRLNSEYIFVYETGNWRVQIFNRHFEPVSSITAGYLHAGFICTFDVNEQYLLIPSSLGSDGDDESAVQIHKSKRSFEKVRGIMPRLIPYGQQPAVLDYTKIRTGNDQRVLIGYSALPYLFVFDEDVTYLKTIEFKGKSVDRFFKTATEERISEQTPQREDAIRVFMHSFDIKDELLYLIVGGDLIVIDMNKHEMVESYRFRLNDEAYFGLMVRVAGENLYLINHVGDNKIVHANLGADGKIENNAKFILY